MKKTIKISLLAVILVIIDEPKTDVYGGLVAAPAFTVCENVWLALTTACLFIATLFTEVLVTALSATRLRGSRAKRMR